MLGDGDSRSPGLFIWVELIDSRIMGLLYSWAMIIARPRLVDTYTAAIFNLKYRDFCGLLR